MKDKLHQTFDSRILFGLAIILVGVILLLNRMGLGWRISLWDFWPIILIIIGSGQLLQPRELRQHISGWAFVIIGGLFLAGNLNWIDFGFYEFWPVLIILVGLIFLKQALWGNKPQVHDEDWMNFTFVLGGGENIYNSRNLKGGRVTAFMGGGSIDLREADFKEDHIVVDILAVWGGVELKVPANWQVNLQATPIMGGIENKTRTASEGAAVKKLIIKGMAVMGGVEIKN